MLCKTRGIALNYIKFGESSIITRILTEDFGQQSYLVNGVRKAKAKYTLAHFSPLSVLELNVYHRENKNLERIKELKALRISLGLQSHFLKMSIASFIAELVYKLFPENQANAELFNFLLSATSYLDNENELQLFPLFVTNKLIRFSGFSFQNLDTKHLLDIELTPKEFDLYRFINQIDLEEINQIGKDKTARVTLLDKLITFYGHQMNTALNLKSLDVLRVVNK